jgi:hypothetical protein
LWDPNIVGDVTLFFCDINNNEIAIFLFSEIIYLTKFRNDLTRTFEPLSTLTYKTKPTRLNFTNIEKTSTCRFGSILFFLPKQIDSVFESRVLSCASVPSLCTNGNVRKHSQIIANCEFISVHCRNMCRIIVIPKLNWPLSLESEENFARFF